MSFNVDINTGRGNNIRISKTNTIENMTYTHPYTHTHTYIQYIG